MRPERLIGLALLAAACTTPLNYTGAGPRYSSLPEPTLLARAPGGPDSLRVVTFNIQYAIHVDRAIALIRDTPELARADVLMLQEMDEPGTQAVAESLGMQYVYYPALRHPHTHRDFGDALLSRWPMQDDHKIILPHLGRLEHSQRIAVGATVVVRGLPIRVYSVHLGTEIETPPHSRRDQVAAVLADAARFPRVIIAGDMNNHGIGDAFTARGYRWLTQHDPATIHWFNWDHVFVAGFPIADSAQTGVVRDNRGASDHRPVWAVIALRQSALSDSPAPRAVTPGP